MIMLDSLIATGVQSSMGLGQLHYGNKLKKEAGAAPEFEIPKTAEESLASARLQAAQTELPGGDLLRERLKEDMANSIYAVTQAAQSPSQIINSAMRMTEMVNNQEQELAIKSAMNYNENQKMLRTQLNDYAGWENQKWINDVYNPWARKTQAADALMGAGSQNAALSANSLAYSTTDPQNPKTDKTTTDKGGADAAGGGSNVTVNVDTSGSKSDNSTFNKQDYMGTGVDSGTGGNNYSDDYWKGDYYNF